MVKFIAIYYGLIKFIRSFLFVDLYLDASYDLDESNDSNFE